MKPDSDNLISATGGTGRLMLFAGYQKVEHLNDDFVGNGSRSMMLTLNIFSG